MTDTVIEVQNLVKHLRRRVTSTCTRCAAIDLRIERGEFVAIMGTPDRENRR